MGREPEEMRSRTKQLRAGPRTATEARWFLLEAVDDEPSVDVDTALLLTSEVASNAARHGAEPVDVTISVGDGELRVSVFDHGQGFDPSRIDTSDATTGGWGLRIVDQLSSDWGVDRRRDGTEVWFSL